MAKAIDEQPRILVVDDNRSILATLKAALEVNKFKVNTAANVIEALHLIETEPFDLLLCDLQMPNVEDGYAVVSAMRYHQPEKVALTFTGDPQAADYAQRTILLPVDEILIKPLDILILVAFIRNKLHLPQLISERQQASKEQTMVKTNQPPEPELERVAAILERDSKDTIEKWLERVDKTEALTTVSLNHQQRTGHLPKLIQELVQRLRVPRSLGSSSVSEAAVLHGQVRQKQGYSVPMLVGESRILQVSIFETLQNNMTTVDFNMLLLDVMTIADEVDSQLEQTISSFLLAAGSESSLAAGGPPKPA